MPKTSVECPSCHTPLTPAADYCAACGQELCPVCQALLAPADTSCSACGTTFDLLCPRCDTPLPADAEYCATCGLPFSEEGEAQAADLQSELIDEDTRECPTCSELIYLPDGFCRECGQELCPRCGEAIAEADDVCAHCGLVLYFSCPGCAFELMAGTEICPNCQALFPNYCTGCGERVEPADVLCTTCNRPVSREPRPGARIVQVVRVGERRAPVLACPTCDEHFTPALSDCPRCNTRICPRCQVTLETADNVCPLCGLAPKAVRAVVENGAEREAGSSAHCPACAGRVPQGIDICPHCQQTLCPQCLAAVDDEDLVCSQCGAEFEFACPTCDALVGPYEEQCAQCGLLFK